MSVVVYFVRWDGSAYSLARAGHPVFRRFSDREACHVWVRLNGPPGSFGWDIDLF